MTRNKKDGSRKVSKGPLYVLMIQALVWMDRHDASMWKQLSCTLEHVLKVQHCSMRSKQTGYPKTKKKPTSIGTAKRRKQNLFV